MPLRPCSIRVAPQLELDDSDRGDRKERMEEGLEGRREKVLLERFGGRSEEELTLKDDDCE